MAGALALVALTLAAVFVAPLLGYDLPLRTAVVLALLGWALVSLLRLPPLDGPPIEEANLFGRAVAVGSLFHFTDQSPIKARMFMRVAGVDVRTEAA